jgi:catechol 2,3-dioxygenase-like lactoylglutathione lyase family enzyme
MTERPPAGRLHHVGVQVDDLANSLTWYRDFFGAQENWSTDRFSELTKSRLPGIVRLVEVACDGFLLHLFERAGGREAALHRNGSQFQHICIAVGSAQQLVDWRQRWLTLFESGKYTFTRTDPPTEIIRDGDGTQSFYCFDVNGLEFEFTHLPDGAR